MNERKLARLGRERIEAFAEYLKRHEAVKRALIDELVARPDREVTKAAELTGLSRRAIYDLLESEEALALAEARAAEATPPPAPHDTDRKDTP